MDDDVKMTKLVDEVAEIIHDNFYKTVGSSDKYKNASGSGKRGWRGAAQAVIKALEEGTIEGLEIASSDVEIVANWN